MGTGQIILGLLFIFAAQLVTATQIIVEEALMTKGTPISPVSLQGLCLRRIVQFDSSVFHLNRHFPLDPFVYRLLP